MTESEKKMKTRKITINGQQLEITANRKTARTLEATRFAKKLQKTCPIKIGDWVSKDEDKGIIERLIDLLPKLQRTNRYKFLGTPKKPEWNTKLSEIIEKAVWEYIQFGLIVLHKEKDGSITGYQYESIDGGHRKRAIKAFMNDELLIRCWDDGLDKPATGLATFSMLTKEEQEYFLNIELNFLVYEGLTNYEKGIIFRTTNKTTDVNFQEFLNSFGDTEMANYIRCVVDGRGIEFDQHEFFELSSISKTQRTLHIQDTNAGLKHEELLTKCLYLLTQKELVNVTDKKLEDFMLSGKVDKKFKKFLDTLSKLRAAKRDLGVKSDLRLSTKEIRIFTMLLVSKGFTINQNRYQDFWKAFSEAIDTIYDKDGDYVDTRESKDDDKTKLQRFDEYTAHWHNANNMTKLVDWLCDELDLETLEDNQVISYREDKRAPTKKDREITFKRQGYFCQVEKELHARGIIKELNPCKLSDCDSAHIDPFAGGRSGVELGEFFMVKRRWHRGEHESQGQKNFYDYIDYLEKKLEKAA